MPRRMSRHGSLLHRPAPASARRNVEWGQQLRGMFKGQNGDHAAHSSTEGGAAAPVMIATASDIVNFFGSMTAIRLPRRMI